MNVHLIGFRGAGKTTVARRLALALGWDWADCDVELELRAGKSIAAIFADDGEAAFRDLEAKMLDELTRRERIVVAAGGGAVLREDNRTALARGKVAWLKARPETIAKRLEEDESRRSQRPPLTSLGAREEIERLLIEREPWYRCCADCEVDVDDRSPDDVAIEIRRKFAADLMTADAAEAAR